MSFSNCRKPKTKPWKKQEGQGRTLYRTRITAGFSAESLEQEGKRDEKC